MNAVAALAMPHRPQILGSIRKAEPRDGTELARLFAAGRIDAEALESCHAVDEHRHLLVLDIGGSLCASACVLIGPVRARLELSIVDPAIGAVARHEVEQRMAEVALALCEAYGCTEVDIVALQRPRQARESRLFSVGD